MCQRIILSCAAVLIATSAPAMGRKLSGEFAPVEAPVAGCPGPFFTQSARVFDALTLCATRDVPREKLSHAAHVAAQWIDNDGDGAADLSDLPGALRESRATLFMASTGFPDAAFEALGDAMDGMVAQDLYASETAPGVGRRDAAPEELHHLVLNAGWAKLMPEVLSDQPGSTLYREWAAAEAGGHYSYDDPTCDAACKVTEFFYLATAAYLGSAADLVSDEMRLKTRAALADALPGTVAVIEAPAFGQPRTAWPDGAYAHPERITFEGTP